MEHALYPMKFLPLFKNKIWGGNKIKALGFDYGPLPNCGELWALSGVPGNESVVANGFLAENNLSEVLEIYMGELIGERNYLRFGNEFPVLVKLIDAADRLSIQVHPDDRLARERGMENGKTEMWYILQADEGATLVDGFRTELSREEYQKVLQLGLLEEMLHIEQPQAGDVFFIPAGRVHALGKGLLLAEIQQTSDCTYRIYDYNRLENGQPRTLHTQEALDAMDFGELRDGKTHYAYRENETVQVAACPYFTTNVLALTQPLRKDFARLDSFVAYLCVQGAATVSALGHSVMCHAGECILVPAVADMVALLPEPRARLLEVYIDPASYGDEALRHAADRDWQVFYAGAEGEDDEHCHCHHHHDDEHCHCHHE